jgi:hypothetical protein
MITAYAQLFAWKLALHGIPATASRQAVGSRTFAAINGHRDAGKTACPGKYLYALIPSIRTKARALQKAWTGRDVESNFVSSALPDLVMRRRSDGRAVVAPVVNVDGKLKLGPVVNAGRNFAGLSRIWRAGDWDRDGFPDVIGERASNKDILLYRGLGGGKLRTPRLITTGAAKWSLFAPVGDVTGDGWPDLMGQPKGGAMRIYPGRGIQPLGASYKAYAAVPGTAHVPAGRWNSADGAPDSIIREGSRLTVYYGNGPGGWTSRKVLPQTVGAYDWVVGMPSLDGDWHSDLLTRIKSTGYVYYLRGSEAGLGTPIRIGRALGYDLAG